MFRGLRREKPPHGGWTGRSLSWATVGFLGAGALVVAGATPAMAQRAPHRAGPERAFTAPARSATRNTVCQPRPNKPCPTNNPTWSGYVVSPEAGHQMTTVSASWVQTAVTCPKPDAWTLFWVGFDGWDQIGTPTVEQGGSSAQCNSGQGVDYEAWWEMYPTNDVQTVFPISVGDHINSSVTFSSTDDSYTVSVTDTSTHPEKSFIVVASVTDNSYTIALNGGPASQPTSFAGGQSGGVLCSPGAPCLNSSAEWVVEAPAGDGGGLYPLARFRPTVFSSASAADDQGDEGSITANGWLSTALDLASVSGTMEATVTQLKNQGRSFRVVWSRAQLQ
ncbi:MAG TPA: G1 family glutamic endopeptidase [Acidimicrobiales bacterium]|nr:G1 family glutamic endopeptidase [Acidimicrobiales bacterium]